MQIDYKEAIAGLAVLASGAFATLITYIWKGDRARLKSLEEAHTKLEGLVANSVTKQEAEHLFEKAKLTFQSDHVDILGEIVSLREDILKAINQPWRGEERRRK